MIVSLVYLTTQIRQNTRALKTAAHQDTTRGASEFTAQIAENADVARIFRVGLADWSQLDSDERMRFSMLLFQTFFNFQNLYSLQREGGVDAEFWASQRRVLAWYMEQPGVRHWWSISKDRLNSGFVHYVESGDA